MGEAAQTDKRTGLAGLDLELTGPAGSIRCCPRGRSSTTRPWGSTEAAICGPSSLARLHLPIGSAALPVVLAMNSSAALARASADRIGSDRVGGLRRCDACALQRRGARPSPADCSHRNSPRAGSMRQPEPSLLLIHIRSYPLLPDPHQGPPSRPAERRAKSVSLTARCWRQSEQCARS